MLTIILVAAVLLIVGINVVKGLLRGLKKTVGTLISIILAAVAAGIITFIVCKPESSAVMVLLDLVKNLLPDGAIKDIFTVDALGDALCYYASMLVAPFFFFGAYSLLSLVFGIVIGILVRIVPPYKKPGLLVNRLGGVGVGVVCGLIVSVIVLMPFVGTLDMVSDLTAPADETEAGDIVVTEAESGGDTAEKGLIPAEVTDLLGDISESPAVDIFVNVGCGPLYNLFASAEFEGEKVYLKDDIAVIFSIVDDVTCLSGDMSAYDQTQLDALDRILLNLDRSTLLKNAVAGILSTASQRWLAGETFIGNEKFDAGELLNPVVDQLLEIMQTSTKDNITADLGTMKDVFEIFVEHDLLKNGTDYEAMLNKLSSEGIVSALVLSVTSNERMSPLADSITQLSIRALASAIGIPKNADEVYNELMNELATVLSGDTSDRDTIKAGVSEALENYGLNVEGEAIDNITDSMIADLGDQKDLTASDVSEFFAVYAAAAATLEDEVSAGRPVFDLLGNGEDGLQINEDGTVTIDGEVLKNYDADSLYDSGAYTMGERGADFGDAGSLSSSETMITNVTTMDDIFALLGDYGSCENIEEEAGKVAGLLGEAAAIMSEVDFNNPDMAVLLGKFGALLDSMSDTEIFGGQTAQGLLTAILQSETIGKQLGISKKEMTALAEKMNEMANKKGNNYAAATTAVADTVNMLNSATNADMSKEEKKAYVKTMLDNLTPDSAEMLGSMMTPSMVAELGVPQTHSASIASVMTTLLNKMAAYDTGSNDASAVEREVEAVNHVLDLAMNMNDNKNKMPMFNSEAGAGRIDATADEFIELLVNSEVISETLIETVHTNGNRENPLGIPAMSENDQAITVAALENYYETHKGTAGLVEKLDAIAAVLNVSVDFN